MASWHERLQIALTKRGRSWSDLVAVTGLAESSVYAWRPHARKRTQMMAADHAAVVCDYLRINPAWLFMGKGASGLAANGNDHKNGFFATEDEIEMLEAFRGIEPDSRAAISLIINRLHAR